jgi:hypothetical protein
MAAIGERLRLKITHNLDGGEMRRNDIYKRRKYIRNKVRNIEGAYLTVRGPLIFQLSRFRRIGHPQEVLAP